MRCPKPMRSRPCGGVSGSGGCEVDERRCPFLDDDPVPSGIVLPQASSRRRIGTDVVVDVRGPAVWVGAVEEFWARTAAVLQECTALLGEHVDNPKLVDDASPSGPGLVVAVLASRGVPTIATVTGRDRNLYMAEARIRAFRDTGCGGHPLCDGGPSSGLA